MEKKLDLSKSVYDLVKEYPEVTDIMKELGFSEITNKVMLNSVGKIMTIPKGAKMKGVSMIDIVGAFMKAGFTLEGDMPNLSGDDAESAVHPGVIPTEATTKPNVTDASANVASSTVAADAADAVETNAAASTTAKANTEENFGANADDTVQDSERVEQLKGFLKRLGTGEELGAVREDFASQFAHVEASEIMKAEQELIKEGTPITEVQKLCDVHSALFHGATKEEKIANAEKAVEESLKKEETSKKLMPDAYNQKHAAAKTLRETVGHPMYRWALENEKIAALIHEIQGDIESGNDVGEKLSELRQISIHYAEKGDLVYPVLKVRYEISGPSDVMWTVDDEIRDELAALDKISDYDEEWMNRLQTVLKRADEMIYKENNILYPICAVNFSREEWYGIYEDAKDYAPVFGVEMIWDEAEKYSADKKARTEAALSDGEIILSGGHMTVPQLEALLNTLPIEITFVDDNNINRFFNEGPKVFKRPQMAIDREVFSCHPPKIEPMVRAILDDFRNNKRDRVPVWMEKNGKPFLVTYMAVRDKKGNYLGTVEVVQDMQFAKEHFEQ